MHDHAVGFYDTEPFLYATVCGFLAPALRDGSAAIVVASAAHRRGFDAALAQAGIDVETARREGRYLALDAADLLALFMVDGELDPARFRATVGGVMDDAARHGRGVRVYGEMVALLWAEGAVAQALALEDLWNELAAIREFELLCAYPTTAFADASCEAAFTRICEQHSTVIPSEGYSLLDDSDRPRAVALLQQQAAALRPELRRLRARQEILEELAYVDALTGLGNRHAFDGQLTGEWALTRRRGTDSFVVVADINALKQINDSGGHATGDQVLRQFAAALRSASRGNDVVARIGGDEFAVLLVGCDERAAEGFTARLYDELARSTHPLEAMISVSVGHASLLDASSPAKALERADLAMFERKRSRGAAASAHAHR